jgi:hypothetical protein
MAVALFDGPAISVVIVGSIGTFLTFVGVYIAMMQYRTRLHRILDEERVAGTVALASSEEALYHGVSSVSQPSHSSHRVGIGSDCSVQVKQSFNSVFDKLKHLLCSCMTVAPGEWSVKDADRRLRAVASRERAREEFEEKS